MWKRVLLYIVYCCFFMAVMESLMYRRGEEKRHSESSYIVFC